MKRKRSEFAAGEDVHKACDSVVEPEHFRVRIQHLPITAEGISKHIDISCGWSRSLLDQALHPVTDVRQVRLV